ncbi:hypothetical protein [Roseibacillus persicicus]|uniref:hypothetical protein n=1 Tax=Roseibacillus persicicus TaxID=454148 RepID=UPI00280F8FDB|nr:hypothetical protein [Roseibacillus persicicus]MDQ8192650.1 hypothetical protein [Roseibacillus persicicus]
MKVVDITVGLLLATSFLVKAQSDDEVREPVDVVTQFGEEATEIVDETTQAVDEPAQAIDGSAKSKLSNLENLSPEKRENPWVEVASDAVKIGLGALIAALSALVIGERKHKHNLRERYADARRLKIADAMSGFMKHDLDAMGNATLMADIAENRRLKKEATNDVARNTLLYDGSRDELHKLNAAFNGLEATLYLSDAKTVADMIESYRVKLFQFTEVGIVDDTEWARLVPALTELHEIRYTILTQLSSCYKDA